MMRRCSLVNIAINSIYDIIYLMNVLNNESENTVDSTSKLIEFTNSELKKIDTFVKPLIALRHDLFMVSGSEYSQDLPIADQLYDDASYNVDFISHDLGLRKGNTLDYHQTTEKYDKGLSEEHAERDYIYRQSILTAAQELGFVSKHPKVASDPLDQYIGILDSELEPIHEQVAAVVINGAAGMSNVKRVRDAIRNIESGAINTDRIILSAGTRPVSDAEKSRVKAPYRAGDSEYELMIYATEDLLGITFESTSDTINVEYGENLTAKVETAYATIGDRLVTIQAVEAPFDTQRTMSDGSKAKRINTEETFLAALPLIEGKKGAVVMESHDAWTPWQNLIAHKVFGLAQNRTVYPAGPFNAERVFWSEENGQNYMEIRAPQDVVDEIVKTYKQLVQMQTNLLN
jgi:hypothetical protein